MESILEAIENLIQAAGDRAKPMDGDYIGEDGLLYCGKCHTAKQCRVELFGEVKTVSCICICMQNQIEENERIAHEEERKRKTEELRITGFPNRAMRDWTFENDDKSNPKLTKALRTYVDRFSEMRKNGKGLLLYGTFGTGKTYAACEVANALIDKCVPALVTNFSRILNTLQGSYQKQEYLDDLNRYDLLVLDDLAAERDTSYAKEQVFNVIDERYRCGLPMIITTNLGREQLSNPQTVSEKRLYDRILERCYPIEVTGQSRRRKNFEKSFSEMQDIFGM